MRFMLIARSERNSEAGVDGPFAGTEELIAGFWLIELKSLEEAVESVKRAPLQVSEIEIRQVHEAEDFQPSTQKQGETTCAS